jgi:hypothetical protein
MSQLASPKYCRAGPEPRVTLSVQSTYECHSMESKLQCLRPFL